MERGRKGRAGAYRQITSGDEQRTAASLNIGASIKLTLKNLPKRTAVTWKSSNTKIATVANGKVKAKAPG